MNKRRLTIIGAGELGLQIAHYALLSNKYKVIGYFDDYENKSHAENGFPILGKIEDIMAKYKNNIFDEIFIAIGYKHLNEKKDIYNKLNLSVPFATIISPSSYIDKTASIGNGVIIYPGSIIDKGVVIHDNVLLNLSVNISHDSIIKSHSFLAPRVALAGFTDIGECCFIGINATVADNVKICDNVIVGAGALVINDIINSGTYVGVPSRMIR